MNFMGKGCVLDCACRSVRVAIPPLLLLPVGDEVLHALVISNYICQGIGLTASSHGKTLVSLSDGSPHIERQLEPQPLEAARPACYQHFCEKIIAATGRDIDFDANWLAGLQQP